jgi:hypothetical protein
LNRVRNSGSNPILSQKLKTRASFCERLGHPPESYLDGITFQAFQDLVETAPRVERHSP